MAHQKETVTIDDTEIQKHVAAMQDVLSHLLQLRNQSEQHASIIGDILCNTARQIVDLIDQEKTSSNQASELTQDQEGSANNNVACFTKLQQQYNITPRPIESIATQKEPRPVRTLRDVLSILDWAPEELQNHTDENSEFTEKLIEFLAEHNMLDKITKKPLQLQIGGNDIFISLGRLALEKEIQGWTVSDKDREENPEYYKQYSPRPRLYKERIDKKVLAPDYIKQSDTYGRHWDTGLLYKDHLHGLDLRLRNLLEHIDESVMQPLQTKDKRLEAEIDSFSVPRAYLARIGQVAGRLE
ncbi:MAG: hypothetical protein U0518_00725 [Candidatus Gracilibacteria bacterium]